MELLPKYKFLYVRAHLNPIMVVQTTKLCKEAKDMELVLIFETVRKELIKRKMIK